MKKKIIFAAIAVLVVGFMGFVWLGCNLAGGISHRSVAEREGGGRGEVGGGA